MTSFNLLHIQPDHRKFRLWATRQKYLPPGGDLGYAFHAALSAAFGALAPKPFFYRDEYAGLLAYTSHSADDMREAAALASPELSVALGLDEGPHSPGINIRPYPTKWKSGQALGFEVRVRPVRREHFNPNDPINGKNRERDALLFAIECKQGDEHLDRESIYRNWLQREFTATGAASLIDAHLTRFKRTEVIRRAHAIPGCNKPRKVHTFEGPDATFCGHISVDDPDAFARLLARGVGRHRSFGFGMLLLKPASIVT